MKPLFKKNTELAKFISPFYSIMNLRFTPCIDGEAILDYSSIDYMVQVLENNPKYGAVTGNPCVRNRSTILVRL